jgi:hypothetical protein
MILTSGIVFSISSKNFTNRNFNVNPPIKPIKVITTINVKSPMPGIFEGIKSSKKLNTVHRK